MIRVLFAVGTIALFPLAAARAQSDCAGMVPTDLSNTIQVAVPHVATQEYCSQATSDGSGNIAVRLDHSFSFRTWSVFGSDGSPQGSFSTDQGSALPLSSGFADTYFGNSQTYFQTYNGDGSIASSTAVAGTGCNVVASPSSEGGAVTITACATSTAAPHFARWDEMGNLIGEAQIGYPGTDAVAVGDVNGNNLVVYFPGTSFGFGARTYVGVWYDDSGAAISDVFYLATDAREFSHGPVVTRALIAGGAAVQIAGVWQAASDSGVGAAHAPPQFLANHPDWDFAIIRGRQAYALLSRGASPTYYNHMPIYSAAGNRCGAVDYPEVSSLYVGADGSVIGASKADACNDTVWPALLSAP